MVAKGATLADIKKKAAEINAKLGDKLEIPESEIEATVEACKALIRAGEDLGSGSALAADKLIAQAE